MEGSQISKLVTSVPNILEYLYKDLAQPSVKKVGIALEIVFDLSNTILLPIKLLNEKANLNLKKHLDNYKSKLENVKDDNLSVVPPEIGIPIIDKLTYVTNDEIANLFINLLTKASVTNHVNQAHPGFVQLIDRLSVDEAKIIKYLWEHDELPCVTLRTYAGETKDGFYDTHKHDTGIDTLVKLDFPQNSYIYIDNLVSMGILSIDPDVYKMDMKVYDKLIKKYTTIGNELVKMGIYKSTEIERSYFKVTSFGRLFINACNSTIRIPSA